MNQATGDDWVTWTFFGPEKPHNKIGAKKFGFFRLRKGGGVVGFCSAIS